MSIKRIDRNNCVAICIDYQTKLMGAMYDKERLFDRSARMFKICRILGIPVIVTEQNNEKLGGTEPVIAEALGEYTPINKFTFSCCGSEEFMEALEKTGKKQVIITGTETHICVLQTVLDLMEKGYEVFVAADCLMSRDMEDRKFGLKRMGASGAVMSTYEALTYELMQDSRIEEFRGVSKVVK